MINFTTRLKTLASVSLLGLSIAVCTVKLSAQFPQTFNTSEIFIWGGLTWSPDGSMVGVGTSKGVLLHSSSDLAVIEQLSDTEFVSAVDWSADRDKIASGHSSGLLQIWGINSHELINTIQAHETVIADVEWSPDGNFLATISWDKNIRIWHPDTGEQIRNIELGKDSAVTYSISWSPDSEKIAVHQQSEILILNSVTGMVDFSWAFENSTSSLKWSPDGNSLAAGIWEGQVNVWNPVNGDLLNTLEADGYVVAALTWSPDSQLLATVGSTNGDGMLRVWDTMTGSMVTEVPGGILTGDSNSMNGLTWSPLGDRIAGYSDDGRIILWDTDTYEVEAIYDGYKSILLSNN